MKKSDLQKSIKHILQEHGFVHVKGDDFAIDSKDGKTKFILHIPDGKRGFILGAQFSDLSINDGLLSHSVMKQYDFAYDLAFGSVKDYSVDDIAAATERVCNAYSQYFESGYEAIKEHINEWTFGDLDHSYRDSILRYFGLPVDPYSEDSMKKTVEELSGKGSMMLPLDEYYEHKAFYDRYQEYGGIIMIHENDVSIDFYHIRKWYQE